MLKPHTVPSATATAHGKTGMFLPTTDSRSSPSPHHPVTAQSPLPSLLGFTPLLQSHTTCNRDARGGAVTQSPNWPGHPNNDLTPGCIWGRHCWPWILAGWPCGIPCVLRLAVFQYLPFFGSSPACPFPVSFGCLSFCFVSCPAGESLFLSFLVVSLGSLKLKRPLLV